MKKSTNLFVRYGSLLLGLAAICSAASFTGKVVAGTCQPGQAATCEVTESTTAYALQTAEGKILKLDAGGNTAVAKLAKENMAKVKAGKVLVDGVLEGETVKVASVKLAD
jgi:hypothetical protein